MFGVWRKGCVSVWFSNCEIQDFNRQWSSALICIFSSREIMSSLWIDGEKVILWWINLFSPVYGDKNNEKKLFFVHSRSWHLIHVITRLFRLPAKVKWEMLCETWNRHSFHIISRIFLMQFSPTVILPSFKFPASATGPLVGLQYGSEFWQTGFTNCAFATKCQEQVSVQWRLTASQMKTTGEADRAHVQGLNVLQAAVKSEDTHGVKWRCFLKW